MSKRWNTSKPLKMWIDGTCFNIRPYDKYRRYHRSIPEKDSEYTTQNLKEFYKINLTEDGTLATRFCLPLDYYKLLSNFSQFKLKCLEQETETQIYIPDYKKGGYISISGKNERDIGFAREVIHSVVGEIREKILVGQFLAIPVNNKEIQKNFHKFKEELLNGETIDGLDSSIFISSQKLHLTISVFSLLDELEKKEAISTLNDCNVQVIEPFMKELANPIKIKVAGIDCMNDNLSKVNVLYAKATIEDEGAEDLLQKLANDISTFFYNKGLIRQYQDIVKLHVTLLNTRYRKVSGESSLHISKTNYHKRFNKREPFDARKILEKYKDYKFGTSVFDSIHLCYMSSIGEDGFYRPLSVIRF